MERIWVQRERKKVKREGEEEVGLSYLMKDEIQVNGNLLFALKTVGPGLSAV